MEIDWTVSKQTTILIDLHFSLFGLSDSFCQAFLLITRYVYRSACVFLH